MRLIFLSCAWILGIYLGSKALHIPIIALLAFVPALLLLLLRHDRQTILWTTLCLSALLGGFLHLQQSVLPIDENALQFYNDRELVELNGVIEADPEIREQTIRLRVAAQQIKSGNKWRSVSGSMMVYVSAFSNQHLRNFPYYRYGDFLSVQGKLEGKPQSDEGCSPEEVGYWDYLSHHQIHSIMYYPREVELLSGGHGSKLMEWVLTLRNRLSQSLSSALPEPQGSLAQGLLLGIRSHIPASLLTAFAETGTRHIIAISGLHMSIVVGIFLSLGAWLFGKRRQLYLLMPFCIVWFYALLTGMRPSVLRAAIMASLFLIATALGRQRSATTALAVAAGIMVGIQPSILWDTSFQLSFTAMLGLILVAPPLQSLGRRCISPIAGEEQTVASIASVTTDSFAISLGTIAATLPIIAYNFHLISLVAAPATFLILPALPAIIVTTLIVGSAGLIFPPLAWVLGWVAWLFLSYVIWVVRCFDALPFAFLKIDSLGASAIVGYYAILTIALLLVNSKNRLPAIMAKSTTALKRMNPANFVNSMGTPPKWLLASMAIFAILIWLAVASAPGKHLEVSFLDVGQGDAILIQQGTQQILVDGGPSPNAICLELGEKMPFWDRNIDLLVLTHPQEDHIAGLVEVLRRYRVEQVLEPGFEYDIPAYKEWLKLIDEKNIKRTIAQAGQQIELGDDVRIDVLHPREGFLENTNSDVNNSSVVLHLVEGEISFLLTGDIENESEQELLYHHARELESTVLKVGHHGSDTSTCPEFLEAVDPRVAVISVGAEAKEKYGHPGKEVMARLKERLGKDKVYLTSEHGTIAFTTDGERLWVETDQRGGVG
jgi:competence protein ComEC